MQTGGDIKIVIAKLVRKENGNIFVITFLLASRLGDYRFVITPLAHKLGDNRCVITPLLHTDLVITYLLSHSLGRTSLVITYMLSPPLLVIRRGGNNNVITSLLANTLGDNKFVIPPFGTQTKVVITFLFLRAGLRVKYMLIFIPMHARKKGKVIT